MGRRIFVMESEREAKQLSDERLEAKRATKLFAPQRARLKACLKPPKAEKFCGSS
jgi:hypothetical protein